jgi:hypothetical protein
MHPIEMEDLVSMMVVSTLAKLGDRENKAAPLKLHPKLFLLL